MVGVVGSSPIAPTNFLKELLIQAGASIKVAPRIGHDSF